MTTCKYCGAPLGQLHSLEARCSYCNQINMTSGDGSANIYTLDDLYKLMHEAASVNAVNDIKKYASIINSKSEGTFSSLYFEKYANYRLKIKNDLAEFMNEFDGEMTNQDRPAIIHLIQHGELKDKKIINRLLKRHAPEQLKTYQDIYSTRIKAEDNYAKVPRDVFICYEKSNLVVAYQIIKMLEAESISCWISERNLREEGFSNYWVDIEDAIDKANLVVLVSSESEMNSPDVARELEYANEHNKKIVEFKIDSTPHNLSFDHLFYGIQWIDGTTDLEHAYVNLKKRVFHDLKLIKKEQKALSNNSKNDRSNKTKNQKTNPNSFAINGYYVFLSLLLMGILLTLRVILPVLNIDIPFDYDSIEALLS